MGNTENILSDSPLRRILDVLSNYSYKLLSLGDQKTKMSQCMQLCKSYAPKDASKCHKVDNPEAFAGLCICSCRNMLKEHSSLTSDSPPQQKGPKKKIPLGKQQRASSFLGSLSISRSSFYFLSKKSYFVC
jgi:hypothetical protein